MVTHLTSGMIGMTGVCGKKNVKQGTLNWRETTCSLCRGTRKFDIAVASAQASNLGEMWLAGEYRKWLVWQRGLDQLSRLDWEERKRLVSSVLTGLVRVTMANYVVEDADALVKFANNLSRYTAD